MGNHNILITNPKGERTKKFAEDISLNEAKNWLYEFGPAPIGWQYQITNSARKKKYSPDHILLMGYAKNGEFVASTKANHKTNSGWYTVKMAKRDLRKQGASWFTREKVYSDAATNSGQGTRSQEDLG